VSAAPILLDIIDTQQSKSIQRAYAQAVQKDADLIVGPLLKPEVQALSATRRLQIPVLSLNYLASDHLPMINFYQFGLSPLDEIRQATQHAWQNDYRSALIIVPKNKWGQEIADAFAMHWEKLGGQTIDRLYYTPSPAGPGSQLRNFLKFTPPNQRREDFDVIFLGAS